MVWNKLMYWLLLCFKSFIPRPFNVQKSKQADRYTWRNFVSASFNLKFTHTFEKEKEKKKRCYFENTIN